MFQIVDKIKSLYKHYHAALVMNSREIINPYFGSLRRLRANIGGGKSFSIISNNCWGGHAYRYFNLTYTSPTIGLFFFADEYIQFLSNLHFYLNQELSFIKITESKYHDELLKRGHDNVIVGKLADIEIVFLHYHSEQEAYEKWKRRRARVNYDDLIVKMSEQNLCEEKHIKAFDNLPYNKKFVFTHKDYGIESQVVCPEYSLKGEVSDDTTYFRKHINLINLVKGLSYKR